MIIENKKCKDGSIITTLHAENKEDQCEIIYLNESKYCISRFSAALDYLVENKLIPEKIAYRKPPKFDDFDFIYDIYDSMYHYYKVIRFMMKKGILTYSEIRQGISVFSKNNRQLRKNTIKFCDMALLGKLIPKEKDITPESFPGYHSLLEACYKAMEQKRIINSRDIQNKINKLSWRYTKKYG